MKKLKKLGSIFAFIISFLFILLIFTTIWSRQNFGKVTINEIVYSLSMPLNGTQGNPIFDYALKAFLPSVVVLIVILLTYILLNKKLNPKLSDKNKKRTLVLFYSIMLLASSITGAYLSNKNWDILDYIEATSVPSDFIEKHYYNPKNTKIKFPKKKRNLIYIFAESMETSYQAVEDGGNFPTNRISELTNLSDEHISFSRTQNHVGAHVPFNGSWTIAGIVCQTAGIPLNIPVGRNKMSKYSEFLPGATTLGDILEKNGYKNYMMFGSDKAFAGRDHYLEQHGNYKIFDLYWAIDEGKLPEGENDWWGFQDSRLFEYAKDKLTEISKNKEPFNFSLLTVDTHAQDGYLNDYSSSLYDDQYSNVIKGSARQIKEFLDWCKKQKWYDNTTIIISGDHLTMDRDYLPNEKHADELENPRGVYNLFINSKAKTKKLKNRAFTTIDMFPTTLAALGCNIDGERLGLGTNLFSNKKTYSEIYSYEYIDNEFKRISEFYYRDLLGLKVKKNK